MMQQTMIQGDLAAFLEDHTESLPFALSANTSTPS